MKVPYNMVYLLHMLFVGEVLVYAGYTGYSNCAKQHDKGIFIFRCDRFICCVISRNDVYQN